MASVTTLVTGLVTTGMALSAFGFQGTLVRVKMVGLKDPIALDLPGNGCK